MIYLFCNTGYGEPFLKSFIKYINEYNVKGIIIFSNKGVNCHGVRKYLREFFFAKRYRAKVILLDDVNAPSFASKIKKEDYGIIAGFNQIFKTDVISRFSVLVNFHPSLLPLYRGPVPSYWVLQNNERYSGFTLHRVTSKIDSGEILYQKSVQIDQPINVNELDLKIAYSAVPTLVSFLDYIRGGGKWNSEPLDPTLFYSHDVNYLSFPKKK